MRAPVLPKAKGLRRVERWLVGIAMTIAAVVLERIVLRRVGKGAATEESPSPPTTLTSRGGEVDL